MTESNKPYIDIGRRITELRESKWLEPKELADQLGVTPSSIYKYESGDRAPGRKILEKMSSLFKVHSDYILYGTHDKLPQSVIEPKKTKDLLKILEQEQELTMNGELLTPEDLEVIKAALEQGYHLAKKLNKRKK